MKILLISGYKGSGKDEASQYFLHKDFEKVSFATELKKQVAIEYNLPLFTFEESIWKERFLLDYPVVSEDNFSKEIHKLLKSEFRTKSSKQAEFIEYVGSSLKMRTTMSDGLVTFKEQLYWTPRALMILHGSIGRSVDSNHWVKKALEGKSGNIVVSDWRYKSEYDTIVKIYGRESVKTIRIDRFETVNTNHDSERNLDNFEFDHLFENKGTLQDLYQKLGEIL